MVQIKNALLGCAAALLVAAPAFSQSLVSVAKQEEARRNAVKAPSKTYTNSSLKADTAAPSAGTGAKSSPPPSAGAPAAPAPGAMAAPVNGSPAATATPEPPAAATLDEGHWRRRAMDLRTRVEKTKAEVDKLTGIKHADPREQAKVDALLKRMQDALGRADESLKAFVQEAATAGVPPAWIQ